MQYCVFVAQWPAIRLAHKAKRIHRSQIKNLPNFSIQFWNAPNQFQLRNFIAAHQPSGNNKDKTVH